MSDEVTIKMSRSAAEALAEDGDRSRWLRDLFRAALAAADPATVPSEGTRPVGEVGRNDEKIADISKRVAAVEEHIAFMATVSIKKSQIIAALAKMLDELHRALKQRKVGKEWPAIDSIVRVQKQKLVELTATIMTG